MTHNTREVEEWEKEFDAQFAKGFYNGDWVLFHCPTSDQKDEHPATEEDVKSFIHHQLQKARVQEKMRIKTLLEDLPAFTPCSDKTMGKVADEAKKPAYLTNYLERETVLKLLAE